MTYSEISTHSMKATSTMPQIPGPGTPQIKAAINAPVSHTTRPRWHHDRIAAIQPVDPTEKVVRAMQYSCHQTRFGVLLVATTGPCIRYMAFAETEAAAITEMRDRFRDAPLEPTSPDAHAGVLNLFDDDWDGSGAFSLQPAGTAFQRQVWQALLEIPGGTLATYGQIATKIGKPSAARAVGTAIGANPIAFLIPCHRVVRGDGETGGYMWGPARKKQILAWELAEAAA